MYLIPWGCIYFFTMIICATYHMRIKKKRKAKYEYVRKKKHLIIYIKNYFLLIIIRTSFVYNIYILLVRLTLCTYFYKNMRILLYFLIFFVYIIIFTPRNTFSLHIVCATPAVLFGSK